MDMGAHGVHEPGLGPEKKSPLRVANVHNVDVMVWKESAVVNVRRGDRDSVMFIGFRDGAVHTQEVCVGTGSLIAETKSVFLEHEHVADVEVDLSVANAVWHASGVDECWPHAYLEVMILVTCPGANRMYVCGRMVWLSEEDADKVEWVWTSPLWSSSDTTDHLVCGVTSTTWAAHGGVRGRAGHAYAEVGVVELPWWLDACVRRFRVRS
jgi:hypothetical protein